MKMMSFMKVAMLAAAVALPASFSVAEAKTKLPPGACAVGKKGVLAVNMVCASPCDAATMWCGQRLCMNGQLVSVVPCWGPFCAPKCGG